MKAIVCFVVAILTSFMAVDAFAAKPLTQKNSFNKGDLVALVLNSRPLQSTRVNNRSFSALNRQIMAARQVRPLYK